VDARRRLDEPRRSDEDAGLLLLDYELDALPVVEAGEPVGLITMADVLHGLLQLRGKGPLDIANAVLQAEEDNPVA
jgi:CBS domain-containing protein